MLSLIDIHDQGSLWFKAGNISKAKECWTFAAEKGEANSMFCLGILYLSINTIESKQMAKFWFQKADIAGHKKAHIQSRCLNQQNFERKILAQYINSFTIRFPNIKTYKTVLFGNFEWYVLCQEQEWELIITKNIVDIRQYHNIIDENVTWSNSTLRNWLNTSFYDSFSAQEKMLIKETELDNPNNPVYGTLAGEKTMDRIFLLSYVEVIKYFQMSAEELSDANLLSEQSNNPNLIAYVNMSDEQLNEARHRTGIDYSMANGLSIGWWLRTPGENSTYAVRINCNGALRMHGRCASRKLVGVRPTLWKRRRI